VRKESAVRREFATSCWQSAGRCAALPDLDTRSPEEILGYDEIGLPR
jgi:hypothetical protein